MRSLGGLPTQPTTRSTTDAEGAGFEPAVRGHRTPVFKTGAFDRSATPPGAGKPDRSPVCRAQRKTTRSLDSDRVPRRGGRVAEGTRLLSEYGVHAPSRVRIPPSPLHQSPAGAGPSTGRGREKALICELFASAIVRSAHRDSGFGPVLIARGPRGVIAGPPWLCTGSAVTASEQAARVGSADRCPRGDCVRTVWCQGSGQLWIVACFPVRAPVRAAVAGRRWLCTGSAVTASEQAARVGSADRCPRGDRVRTVWRQGSGQLWIIACFPVRAPVVSAWQSTEYTLCLGSNRRQQTRGVAKQRRRRLDSVERRADARADRLALSRPGRGSEHVVPERSADPKPALVVLEVMAHV